MHTVVITIYIYCYTLLLYHLFAIHIRSCSYYNGSYCGEYFESGIRVVTSGDHDDLIRGYLMDLNITGFEAIISEACYNNIVAILCYTSLEICQNNSNQTLKLCYNNCTSFDMVIDKECPHYVKSRFSQLISGSGPCESLGNSQNCTSLDDIAPGNSYLFMIFCILPPPYF